MRNKITSYLLFIALFVVLGSSFALAVPSGGTVSVSQSSERGNSSTTPGNDSAYAGNVTGLTITGTSITQTWQGYFGNVSGTIQLADANDNALYNWTDANPSGEVYASINSTVTWPSIQCFNFTANGTGSGTVGETAGATNLGGLNLTQLESDYNIGASDVDGVNETFSIGGAITHSEFFVGNLNFSAGECPSTANFDSTGASVDGNFEEALLYEPDSASVVFTSILEQDLSGFNGATYDFEMLVLEDGHATDVASTDYYFFVEIN